MAPPWRSVETRWLDGATIFELRVRSGLRKLSVFLVLAEGRLRLFVHRQESWFTWERPFWPSLSPKDLGPLAELTREPSSWLADICERLREDGWTGGRDAHVAQQILDKISTLAAEREQRLLVLPPAAAIRWTALAREDQWTAIRRGALETTGGSLDVSLFYHWEPRMGSGPSAHWGIHRTKAEGSPGQSSTSGRVPVGDVCCDQAVGDLEDWGWPRPESLSIGRALAEKALSDWMDLEPERARRWQDVEL